MEKSATVTIDRTAYSRALGLLGENGEHWTIGQSGYGGEYCMFGALAEVVCGKASAMYSRQRQIEDPTDSSICPAFFPYEDEVLDYIEQNYNYHARNGMNYRWNDNRANWEQVKQLLTDLANKDS